MTAFIAWLALATSTASLAWQILSWWRSGANVRVTGVALGFGNTTHMHFHIVNSGRFAATITQVGYFVMSGVNLRPGGAQYVHYQESTDGEGDLPLRLEGQADFETDVPLARSSRLRELLDEHPESHLFPWAKVGGRLVYGKRLVDDQMDIRQRLCGYPNPKKPKLGDRKPKSI